MTAVILYQGALLHRKMSARRKTPISVVGMPLSKSAPAWRAGRPVVRLPLASLQHFRLNTLQQQLGGLSDEVLTLIFSYIHNQPLIFIDYWSKKNKLANLPHSLLAHRFYEVEQNAIWRHVEVFANSEAAYQIPPLVVNGYRIRKADFCLLGCRVMSAAASIRGLSALMPNALFVYNAPTWLFWSEVGTAVAGHRAQHLRALDISTETLDQFDNALHAFQAFPSLQHVKINNSPKADIYLQPFDSYLLERQSDSHPHIVSASCKIGPELQELVAVVKPLIHLRRLILRVDFGEAAHPLHRELEACMLQWPPIRHLHFKLPEDHTVRMPPGSRTTVDFWPWVSLAQMPKLRVVKLSSSFSPADLAWVRKHLPATCTLKAVPEQE